MQETTVTIKGVTPLLMRHRKLSEEPAELKNASPEEQAENSAYRDDNKQLFIPSVCLWRALVNAGAYSKAGRSSTKKKEVAAGMFIKEDHILLGTSEFEVDSRWVRIKATGGSCMRHRPKITHWQCTFTLQWEQAFFKEKEVRKIVDDCGSRVGVLDFRPEKTGPFGKFMVILWR